MDLLASIRVPWDFVDEVPRAGVAVGIGFDGEQQVSEFGGVFLFLGEDAFSHRPRGRIILAKILHDLAVGRHRDTFRKLMTYLLAEPLLGRDLCRL
jgi:hypothetical protein